MESSRILDVACITDLEEEKRAERAVERSTPCRLREVALVGGMPVPLDALAV